jgi:site-specific DNA-methyltransferase (adenine-specific)
MLANVPPQPIYDQDGITLYYGDCAEILPRLAKESVAHFITDPPYTPHVHRSGRSGDAAAVSVYRDLAFVPLSDDLRRLVGREAARLTLGWVLIFCAMESAGGWKNTYENHGLEFVRVGVWVKLGAAPQFSGDRPANCCEAIAIGHPRRRKRWNKGGHQGIWHNQVVNAGRLHPAEKPIRLMKQLLTDFTQPGDLILDPFAGSGTTLCAAKELGRHAIGIEIDADYCDIIIDRLRQGILPLDALSGGGGC